MYRSDDVEACDPLEGSRTRCDKGGAKEGAARQLLLSWLKLRPTRMIELPRGPFAGNRNEKKSRRDAGATNTLETRARRMDAALPSIGAGRPPRRTALPRNHCLVMIEHEGPYRRRARMGQPTEKDKRLTTEFTEKARRAQRKMLQRRERQIKEKNPTLCRAKDGAAEKTKTGP